MEPENTTRPLTKGEFRVGINFNPSNNGMVDQIKKKAAELIDLVDQTSIAERGNSHSEINTERARLRALAMTAIEDGAMWAVKAATKA
jgi:hypothetical protein